MQFPRLHRMRRLDVGLKFNLGAEVRAARLTRETLSLWLSMSNAVVLHQGFLGRELRATRLTSEFWHVSRVPSQNYRINGLSLTVKRSL